METFEKRAKERNMPAAEVAETYKQMNRLLDAQTGAVGPHERQLAAKSFMSHAADPTNIDQGQHNTCNVTSLAERTMTRTPSKMAEVVASAAIDGKWTAADGKQISLKPESLQPGKEESTFPPAKDGDRTYASQLMNTVNVNDVTQRRVPPEFYSSGRPTATNRTGEKLPMRTAAQLKTAATTASLPVKSMTKENDLTEKATLSSRTAPSPDQTESFRWAAARNWAALFSK